MVGNGFYLKCEGICNSVPLVLQQKSFIIPFYLLLIKGADVVLGAWLRTLGSIQVDFSIPSITFTPQNQPITLKGDMSSNPIHTSLHQLHHLVHTKSISSLHLMIMKPIDPIITQLENDNLTNNIPVPLHPEISKLLTKYQPIFQSPIGLPSPRQHDHHITLLPNTPNQYKTISLHPLKKRCNDLFNSRNATQWNYHT